MWGGSRSKREKDTISMQGIIKWINHLLNIELTCIEALGSGAVYCQIFLLVHPGTIPQHKVKWNAKHTNQFLHNLRLLQNAFEKVGIKRPLEPMKLAKAKCPDNFQLAVWLRTYYYQHVMETDCTLNSSLSSKVDFSFAQQRVVPKHFNPLANREEESLCLCCIRSQKQVEMARKIQVLSVKFQMIRQVLQSRESALSKIGLIEQFVKLQFEG